MDGAFFDKAPVGSGAPILDKKYRNTIMAYSIPYVEVKTKERPKIIDIFKRLNKSSTNLNPQELRNAFFIGEFKKAVYDITSNLQEDDYWGKADRVFSKPTTDRMANQQFTSDLLVAMIEGAVQHQSQNLDEYYERYESNFADKAKYNARFEKSLKAIKSMFPDSARFTKNLADFYTLFLYVDELYSLKDLRLDEYNLDVINSTLRKFEADYAEYLDKRANDMQENAILERYRETIVGRQREKEVRQARRDLIDSLIRPGLQFVERDPVRLFSDEQKSYIWQVSKDNRCGICQNIVESWDDYEPDHKIAWANGGRTRLDNGQVSHRSCNRKKQDE